MTARCVMVLGTTSGAGQSWLATALCRWYARRGLKVAPFQAQNMSNNARVVAGGEIGSAHYFQALAARAEPELRMNPLLLKPERDTHSQVVLLGQVHRQLTRAPWRGRSNIVWPVIAQSPDALRACQDVVVIEGGGSPAEINLRGSDIVNMRVARHVDARCLLVADIDRGGACAHLYPAAVRLIVAVLAYPRISVRLLWARTPAQLAGADWVTLPGSKHTSGDLAWLREQGLDGAIASFARQGGAVLGICGGLQMLGQELRDPHGVDDAARGLGLLPLVTEFAHDKTVRRNEATFAVGAGPSAASSDAPVRGYEIHHGHSTPVAGQAPARGAHFSPSLLQELVTGRQ